MNPIRTCAGLALVVLLAACSGGSGGRSSVEPAAADVRITADDLAFDQSTLTVPAGRPFTLALINEESAPHNVAIYTDESKSQKLFDGEPIGEGSIVYEVPALEAGEDYFDCSIHPDMKGTLLVEG